MMTPSFRRAGGIQNPGRNGSPSRSHFVRLNAALEVTFPQGQTIRDRLGEPSLPGSRVAAPRNRAGGFTLIEILLASVAAAIILVAIYGIFTGALHMRDNATARIRESRLRARAATILRRDLQSAMVSGGVLASTLEGDSNKQSTLGNSNTPGYLKMTTTTGKDTADDLYGDVQEVEYYISRDTTGTASTAANTRQGGTLVRAVTRDLLAATTVSTPREEQILAGVESLRVTFYDGTNWQETWQSDPNTLGNSTSGAAAASATSTTDAAAGGTNAGTTSELLPEAIRIDIQQSAPTSKDHSPPPLEILIPWTTQPFTAPSPTPTPGL